ncbi:MAG TPA: right-handed parallel beta-helix repeat-containing protein, partial [bacterium]|nr:right-handed parallel beta-helix repeat-containing protein [bacterium]
PVIKNSVFKGNQAYSLIGGAIYNMSSDIRLINSVFLYNSSTQGGAVYNRETEIFIVNCSFSFNEGKFGGALTNAGENDVTVINSILYNNYGDEGFSEIGNTGDPKVDISYSNIKGSNGSGYKWNSSLGNDLGSNIDEDPVYSMKDLHPLSISAASPCVDKGTRNPLSLEIKEDLLGGNRIFGSGMDMGAYEYNGICQPEICNIEGSLNRCIPLGKTYECECLDGYFWGDKDKKCKKRNIIYVRYDNGSGEFTEDGTSWETAFISINTATNNAKKGDMIWVQKGMYFPDGYPNGGSDQKELHFTLKNGVQIFGGFDGTETELNQRDFVKNETILSGDFHQNDEWDESSLTWKNREDNFYHIFYMPDGVYIDQTAMLDGFILEGGDPREHVVNNHSKDSGGAIFVENGSALIKNCVFKKSGSAAVGINNFNGISFEISNCKFIENFDGQAISSSGRIKIENCEFSNNISIEHAIVQTFGDMTEIRRSLFFNNRGKATGISSRNTIIEDTSFIGNSGSGFGLF